MQLEALALRLRPRPMYEAADLGVRLAQAHAASLWRCYAPLWAAVTLVALACAPIASWLPWGVLFVMKPWLDRTLLFVLSRAVFGEPTRWAALWAARREVWWRDLLRSLTMRRLSPWRAYTQPLRELEGQRGTALRERRRTLLRGKRGAASMLQLVYAHAEFILSLGVYALLALFTPGPDHFSLLRGLFDDDGLGASLLSGASYGLVVLFLEPFYVAAGFAMYLNRRVELEAWDIEREFRHAFAA